MALLTGLILLSAISLLALVSTSGTIMQRQQATNFKAQSRALENAAIAESQARSWLFSRPDHTRQADCLSGCVLPAAIRNRGELPTHPEFESATWWRVNAQEAGRHPETGEVVAARIMGTESAHWLMEEIHFEVLPGVTGAPVIDGVAYYRILSRGAGKHPGSVAVTEAIVARPWEGEFLVASFPADLSGNGFCDQFMGAYPCGTTAWRQRR
jgi:Tfp pilus assembly protein PilX